MLRSLGKLFFAGVAAAAITAAVPARAADDEVKIGLLFDVTGPVANFVPPMLDAAKLAVDQVNAQGGILGGKKLMTVVADTQGSPQVAVDAANKLVNAEKVAAVIGALRARGIPADALGRLRAPAGLDLGAVSPEEIAVSILAEIIRVRRAGAPGPRPPMVAPVLPRAAEAQDPICGMAVAIAGARHTSEVAGARFYFCCAGCKQRFDADPTRYAAGSRT